MNTGRVLLRLTAALVVAGIVGACTRDGGSTRSVAGPRALAEVSEGMIDAYFAPIGNRELRFP